MAVTYAQLPQDGTYERLYGETSILFIVYGVIYTLIALAQLVYAVRYHNIRYAFFVAAFILYGIDCFMAGTNNGTTVLLPFWCYMIYGGVIGLLDSWCKSMRNAIPRPTIIGRWVSVTSMVFIMLSFITIVLTRALLRKGYIIQNWLSDLATIAQFIGLNMVMIMAGVLLKMSPTKTAFKQDRKRREITMLIAVYFLLLLHRIFTQINVPYTEFAIFPLIGIFTLYPLNALEGYSRSTGAPVTKPMNLV